MWGLITAGLHSWECCHMMSVLFICVILCIDKFSIIKSIGSVLLLSPPVKAATGLVRGARPSNSPVIRKWDSK